MLGYTLKTFHREFGNNQEETDDFGFCNLRYREILEIVELKQKRRFYSVIHNEAGLTIGLACGVIKKHTAEIVLVEVDDDY